MGSLESPHVFTIKSSDFSDVDTRNISDRHPRISHELGQQCRPRWWHYFPQKSCEICPARAGLMMMTRFFHVDFRQIFALRDDSWADNYWQPCSARRKLGQTFTPRAKGISIQRKWRFPGNSAPLPTPSKWHQITKPIHPSRQLINFSTESRWPFWQHWTVILAAFFCCFSRKKRLSQRSNFHELYRHRCVTS